MWNSTELHLIHITKDGSHCSISRFMKKITDQMQDHIYCFTSPGISSLVMDKSKASATFKLVQTNGTQEDIDLTKLAGNVKNEIKH